MWLSPRLCFPASYAFITYMLHIFFHFRQIKMLMQYIQSLNNTKMPHQPASMCFTYKQLMHGTWWNTQTTLFKQISIKFIELSKSKITIILVQFYFLCSNPRNPASKVAKRPYLHEIASATMFSFHCLYLITYENVSKNSTYLACLLLNLPCPFRCFNDSWSEYITNSTGHR